MRRENPTTLRDRLTFFIMAIMKKQLLTTAEAAKVLNVSASRIRAMIAAGQLTTEKFGHIHMIQLSDLQPLKSRTTGRPKKAK